MSDFYEDSFDSFESGSDTSEPEVVVSVGPLSSLPAGPRMVDLQYASVAAALGGKGGYGSLSDQEEHNSSSSGVKDERSPKPKRKFMKTHFKKPNIGNIKQKIKSRLRKDTTVFGVVLETAIQHSTLGEDGIELPTVFRECIDHLETTAKEHEGLYRLPGVKSKIEEAKSHYDRGETVDLSAYDPNVVASLLKQYLRELPEPLLPHKMVAKFDAAAVLPFDNQLPALDELMEEVPSASKLMVGWLMEHMKHISEMSNVNKMSLPNLIIVFSPTLQISAPILHLLYNNKEAVFGDVELRRYVRRATLSKKDSQLKLNSSSTHLKPSTHLKRAESLTTELEITSELERLTTSLTRMHNKMAGKYDDKDDIWDMQRSITVLRRKKKVLQNKDSRQSLAGGEEDFMKTLMLMEATLTAENEELIAHKEQLQGAIRKESDLIEKSQKELQRIKSLLAAKSKTKSQSSALETVEEESGDEAELAKKIAALRWHGKELELRNKNLVQSIQEEEEAIMHMKVKLKVIPLKQKLNVDE